MPLFAPQTHPTPRPAPLTLSIGRAHKPRAFGLQRVRATLLLTLLLGSGSGWTQAARGDAEGGVREGLPPAVEQALERARVPRSALVAVVHDVDARQPRLAWQPGQPVNPASLMKLLTTAAALDRLGPAWKWRTPVWLSGRVSDPGPRGVLAGDVVIKGSGDPSLVVERVWLQLRRLRQAGVQRIEGDIVLDRSAFRPEPDSPGDFDGESLRPYNVGADALLLNYKSLQLTLTPDIAAGVARTALEPALAGLQASATVPLSSARCEDWRGAVALDFSNPAQLRLGGSYPVACGVQHWQIAYPDPATYAHRLIAALWSEVGGSLGGTVRDGLAPTGVQPSFDIPSPVLADVVRDINRYSNNVLAQQLFLTLGLQQAGDGSAASSSRVLQAWAAERLGADAQGLVVENGSGLSRENRVSAQALARLLGTQWRSAMLPSLFASLPASGGEGSLRRSRLPTGRAHLKTGSLRDVAGVAGYVLTEGGRWRIVVAVLNHEQAQAARPALDALVQWAMADEPGSAERRPRSTGERNGAGAARP